MIGLALDELGYVRCKDCQLPFARVLNGLLVIESRHGGMKHTNSIRLEDVVELLQERVRQKECA